MEASDERNYPVAKQPLAPAAASGAINPTDNAKSNAAEVKTEPEVKVKVESQECLVCSRRCSECYDVCSTKTAASTSTVHVFLAKFTHSILPETSSICRNCLDLINVLEQAEQEYLKLKQAFEEIISKNPLFDGQSGLLVNIDNVKTENVEQFYKNSKEADDSDEPLALSKLKRTRKPVKRKKKSSATLNETASRQQDKSWECDMCGMQSESGGPIAEATHKLVAHCINNIASDKVKKEDSADGSQNSACENQYENMFEVEVAACEDDSSDYFPEEVSNGKKRNGKVRKLISKKSNDKKKKLPRTNRQEKAVFNCDICQAKYTSKRRFEIHMSKHDSKPPYICEVCGASYKHRKACDIHIAMHKGISEWKCEECNKLFPSKGSLLRHNDIHTGKSNYQCDLCGKSFIHTSSFKMHKLSHSGVKPHSCDVCGLALMTRSHLKRHKRVHSGEKRHECSVCGKRFSERYNLAAHRRAHAGSAQVTEAQAQEPRRRTFRCPYCPERYERRYMLERHCTALHGCSLERAPATPRNTMSKLLKARASGATAAPPAPDAAHKQDESNPKTPKEERPATTEATSKSISPFSTITSGAWSSNYPEFPLRGDFPH